MNSKNWLVSSLLLCTGFALVVMIDRLPRPPAATFRIDAPGIDVSSVKAVAAPRDDVGDGRSPESIIEDACRVLVNESDHLRVNEVLVDLSRALAPEDFPFALARLAALKVGNERGWLYQARNILLNRWARHSPTNALAYAQQISRLPDRRVAVAGVVRAWAGFDLPGASNWVQSLADSRERHDLLRDCILPVMVRSDPGGAIDLARSAKLFGEHEFSHAIFRPWAENDVAGALAGALKMPVGPSRDEAVSSVISVWARRDPAAAAAWITNLPPGSQRRRALQALAQSYAIEDPEAAARFGLQLPSGSARDEMINSVVGIWAINDPSAAVAWVRQLPGQFDQTPGLAANRQFMGERGSRRRRELRGKSAAR